MIETSSFPPFSSYIYLIIFFFLKYKGFTNLRIKRCSTLDPFHLARYLSWQLWSNLLVVCITPVILKQVTADRLIRRLEKVT